MTPNLAKGLHKDKGRGAFLEDIFIMVTKKKEEGANSIPRSLPCAGNQKK